MKIILSDSYIHRKAKTYVKHSKRLNFKRKYKSFESYLQLQVAKDFKKLKSNYPKATVIA